MSQQLDYAPPQKELALPLWQRIIIAVVLLVTSIAITPKAVQIGLISAGAGEGDYFWWRVLFPGSIWVARLTGHDLSGFVQTWMYFQFPIYGVILGVAAFLSRRKLMIAAIVLVTLHAVLVMAETAFVR